MDKLAKLAALQQLRASGALSDEEFQAQKDSVLESKKTWWLGGLAVLLAVVLIAAFLIPRTPADDAKVASISPLATNTVPVTGDVTNDASSESKLGDFIKPENLGVRLAYWEKIVGPAKDSIGQTRNYTVAGCDVDVELDTTGIVFAFGFKPSKRCDINLDPFFSTRVGMASSFTISSLKERGASFRSDCISMCGNAAGDPVVQAVSGGSHADNYRTLIADIVLDDDVSGAASTKWEAAMKRAGRTDEYIQNVEFNCDTTFDKDAINAFGPLPAEHIKITNGYPNLDSDGCGSGD